MPKKEVNKVQLVIYEFGAEICDILPSAEACQKWLKDFHDGLVYRIKGRSKFADKLLEEAHQYISACSFYGSKGGRPRKKTQSTTAAEGASPRRTTTPSTAEMYGYEFTQDAPNGNAGVYLPDAGNRGDLERPTSCDTLTADGDTREDSQDMHSARKGGTLETSTSANLYALDRLPNKANDPTTSAVATTREGVDGHARAGNRATLKSGTAAEVEGLDSGRTSRKKAVTRKAPKSAFGEFGNVTFTDDECVKLQKKLGPAGFERGVEVLGAWKVNNPAKAARIKSDYACFTSWVIRRLEEERADAARKAAPKPFAEQERDRMADIVRNEFPDVIEEFGL